jgi:hypothetical protein
MSSSEGEFKVSVKKVPKEISILKKGVARQGRRYVIYLPTYMNDVWEELRRQGKRVRVHIEVVD